MDHYTRNVLVVEPNPVERERLAAALEETGFQVLECSGPVAPDHTCVGARSGRCPLALDDSIVVLDTHLAGNATASGTSAEELLGFYLQGRHRVVTLCTRPLARDDQRLLQLRRHPETDVLLKAVWWSASPYAAGQPLRTRRGEARRTSRRPAHVRLNSSSRAILHVRTGTNCWIGAPEKRP